MQHVLSAKKKPAVVGFISGNEEQRCSVSNCNGCNCRVFYMKFLVSVCLGSRDVYVNICYFWP